MANSFVLSKTAFEGLDQRAGCSDGIKGFPELTNFYINESGHLQKRGGYKLFWQGSTTPVTKLWSEAENVFAAKEKEVYRLHDQNFIALGETDANVTEIFSFNEKIYVIGGDLYEARGLYLNAVDGYIPLIVTACSPNGAGTVYEKANVLSTKRRVCYNGDGESTVYRLPEKTIEGIERITVNGTFIANGFNFANESFSVNFDSPPPEGINNVEICYRIPVNNSAREMVSKCRYGTVFENRLFLYGNPDYPNYVFHSDTAGGLPSAEYFSETSYHVFDAPVISLTACYNRLIVFCENSAYYTYAELKTNSLGAVYTSFPLFELNSAKGSLAKGNMPSYSNMPVTLCNDGLNRWVSTEIADERTAQLFSQRAFKYTEQIKQQSEKLIIFNRTAYSELWFVVPTGVLIYNYGLDCFYYYSINNIAALCEYGDNVLLGFYDGSIYLHSKDCPMDNGQVIKAAFSTPFCTFGGPYTLKNLNGISLTVTSKDALSGNINITRGNLSEKQEINARFLLSEIEANACRLIRSRLHLKRFYSCRLAFYTYSAHVCISELHLFGKKLKGAPRIN